MRGKYSPTVSSAYTQDQNWHRKYSGFDMYDPEGFDCYGYNQDEVDRAGNHESVYYSEDYQGGYTGSGNWAYDQAIETWTFDGAKPVKK